MTIQPTTVGALPRYSSVFSFLTLLIAGGAGYSTFVFYRNGASDELKYASLVSAIAALVLCCVLLTRSLTKIGMTVWSLKSVKVCIGASVFQTIVGCIYLYAALHLGFANVLFQKPIIYTTITCIVAIHAYMMYTNISQTRLFFLSLTIGIFELIASIVVVIVVLLYVLSRNTKAESSNNNNPMRTGQGTIGGPGTFEAIAMLDGLPTKVRVEASDPAMAARLLEGQYGTGAFAGGRAFAHKV
jgi:hypothetical protein